MPVATYSVQQRIGDFAMRRTLGATPRDVARLVAASVIVAGAVIGLLLSRPPQGACSRPCSSASSR